MNREVDTYDDHIAIPCPEGGGTGANLGIKTGSPSFGGGIGVYKRRLFSKCRPVIRRIFTPEHGIFVSLPWLRSASCCQWQFAGLFGFLGHCLPAGLFLDRPCLAGGPFAG